MQKSLANWQFLNFAIYNLNFDSFEFGDVLHGPKNCQNQEMYVEILVIFGGLEN